MQVRYWLVTFFFCMAVALTLGAIKFTQIRAAIAFGNSFPEPSETVYTEIVENSSWIGTLHVTGEVLPTRALDVRNELAGVIVEVGFASGAEVKKGDLLVQLDVTDEQAQLDAITADIKIAQLDVDRLSMLMDKNVSSRDQLDRANAQLAVVEARARSLRAVIEKKSLVAPFDAIAGLHELEAGSYLSANTMITRLVNDSDELWLDFSVPQEYADLTVGDQVSISSTSLLSQSYQATVIAVSQEIQLDSRNLRARALWQEVPSVIKSGALVDVSLPVGDPQQVVRLPSVAIRQDTFGTYVYVLTKDGDGDWRAARREVEVELKDGETAITTSELELGSRIATVGSFKLREGILVNIATAESDASYSEADAGRSISDLEYTQHE